MPAAGALANVDPASIIARYLADETMPEVAKSLGVHRSGLNHFLLRTCPDQWRDAQVARAVTAFDNAKTDLASADNALDLARAREQLRTAQWELERLLKRLYGPSAELTGKDGGPLQIEVVRYGSELIEGEVGDQPKLLPGAPHQTPNK